MASHSPVTIDLEDWGYFVLYRHLANPAITLDRHPRSPRVKFGTEAAERGHATLLVWQEKRIISEEKILDNASISS